MILSALVAYCVSAFYSGAERPAVSLVARSIGIALFVTGVAIGWAQTGRHVGGAFLIGLGVLLAMRSAYLFGAMDRLGASSTPWMEPVLAFASLTVGVVLMVRRRTPLVAA